MVTRDSAWPSGTPCWVDLGVDDIARATAFYSGLFGWDIQAGPPEAGGYSMCLLAGHAVAGIGPKQGPPGTPPAAETIHKEACPSVSNRAKSKDRPSEDQTGRSSRYLGSLVN